MQASAAWTCSFASAVWKTTGSGLTAFGEFDGVLEDRETVAEFAGLAARPLRMLGKADMSFGMRH